MPTSESVLADAHAMELVRQGDDVGLGQLIERHRDRLVGYLSRLVGDAARGEELAQETFVRVWLAAGRYREEGRFEAYLFRIGTRLARSEERRRRRFAWARARGWLAVPPDRQEPEGPGRLLAAEAASELAAALAELPIRFRAPLLLFVVEERSLEEIGRLMGLPVATVKTRLHRARRRLRARLAGDPAEGES